MIDLDAGQMKIAETLMKHMPEKLNQMTMNVINRVVYGVRTDIKQRIRETYTIKAMDAHAQIHVSPAPMQRKPYATVRLKGSPVPLSKFNIRPSTVTTGNKRKPIYAQVSSGGGEEIKKAFNIRASDGIKVKQRRGADHSLHSLYGPSMPQMAANTDVVKYVGNSAQDRIDKRLNHEINRYLKGIKI